MFLGTIPHRFQSRALPLLQIPDLLVVVLDALSVLGLADVEWAVSATMVSLRSLLYLSTDSMKGRGSHQGQEHHLPREYLALNPQDEFEFTVWYWTDDWPF